MPKITKVEIYQKANTSFAGNETGTVDVLLRTFEGPDAENIAKGFLSKPGREIFYSKVVGESNSNDEVDEEDGDIGSYDELTFKELRAEVEARKLEIPVKAKKKDLIKILQDNDSE